MSVPLQVHVGLGKTSQEMHISWKTAGSRLVGARYRHQHLLVYQTDLAVLLQLPLSGADQGRGTASWHLGGRCRCSRGLWLQLPAIGE
jgi:hypothetical protein